MAKRYRSGTIQIDLSDYIDEIDDDIIKDEFERRKLSLETDSRDIAEVLRDAYEELLRGRPLEARAVLERVLLPKYPDPETAQKRYDAAKATS